MAKESDMTFSLLARDPQAVRVQHQVPYRAGLGSLQDLKQNEKGKKKIATKEKIGNLLKSCILLLAIHYI